MFKKMQQWWIGLDYGVILPFLALLPYKCGRNIASFRGYIYGLLKRDWRTFTFRDDGLRERTYTAYKTICPNLSQDEYGRLVQQRYIHQSIEEFEGALLDKNRFGHIDVEYIGIESVEARIAQNPHAVFVTAHFGSSLLGITLLKRLRIPLLVMSSNVVEHEKVHPALTRFFLKKYRGIDRYLNGGEVLDIEGNGKTFLSFLKQKGSLVIIADLPPNHPNEVPAWKMFFGQERGFAAGAQKLTASTESEMIAFVCYFEAGRYVVKFSVPGQEPYDFLAEAIAYRPEFWWASDILGLLPTKEVP